MPDELAKDAVAFAVQNADAGHAHEESIVDEMHHGVERLVAPFAADVEVLAESVSPLVYRLARRGA